MKTFKFKTTLKRPEGIGTWHYVDTPIRAQEEFDKKGKIRINGKINGVPFSATLIPRGNGEHFIVLAKATREKVGLEIGDEMKMEIWEDTSERVVSIPIDFQTVLSTDAGINTNFNNLAYSHKKAYVDWINDAKKEETRNNRMTKALAMIAENKKLR